MAEVPHLRIVDEVLWKRVKVRQEAVRIEIGRGGSGNALNRARRRRFLLSGLLRCGCCGGFHTIVGQDRYGCASRRAKGTCTNATAIGRREIEERALAGLKDRLMAPEFVDAFVTEFNAELRRAAEAARSGRAAAERTLAELERRIAGILRAIEDGNYNPTLTAHLTALEAEKTAADARLASMAAPAPIRLHPDLPALYQSKVERLAEALNEPGTTTEAGEILRGLKNNS